MLLLARAGVIIGGIIITYFWAPLVLVAIFVAGLSATVLLGCRAWIRTRARGSKVPRATTTQLGILYSAEGRARTDMEVALQQFLRLPRLPIPPLRLKTQVERKTRFELATSSLARRHSTAELLPLYFIVPRRRFELLRAYAHHPLKMACLPIPPPRHELAGVAGFEPATCGFGDRCSTI